MNGAARHAIDAFDMSAEEASALLDKLPDHLVLGPGAADLGLMPASLLDRDDVILSFDHCPLES